MTLEGSRDNVKNQLNIVRPSHKSQGIFKGTTPAREVLIPFSAEMPTWAGLKPSQQRIPETNFRLTGANTHSTISDAGMNKISNETRIPVLFIPFIATCFLSVVTVLYANISQLVIRKKSEKPPFSPIFRGP